LGTVAQKGGLGDEALGWTNFIKETSYQGLQVLGREVEERERGRSDVFEEDQGGCGF
jgi:hypothetical protein